MRTITVSRRARSVNALLKRARRENVILRSPEGEEFILAEIDDFNREVELTRQNKALMKFLDARARQTKTVSLEQARTPAWFNQLGSCRRQALNMQTPTSKSVKDLECQHPFGGVKRLFHRLSRARQCGREPLHRTPHRLPEVLKRSQG